MLQNILNSIDFGHIIFTALTAVLAILGSYIKKIYNQKVTNETVRTVVSDCVNWVENESKTIEIQEKYQVAKEKAVNILKAHNIYITDDEIDIMIGSFVKNL